MGEGRNLDERTPKEQKPAGPALPPGPKHRRPKLTLYRYVAREASVPALIALLGLTGIVLTKDLLGFSELLINRGIGGGVVARIAFYEALILAARMLPFAVLVGALVGLGRMGADREILVLEASGVAAPRLVWPVVAFASVMTLLALLMSLLVAPWSSRSVDSEFERIAEEQPWTQIRAGVVNVFGDTRLDARAVSPEGDRLEGVLLWVPDLGGTVFAGQGEIFRDEAGSLGIALESGRSLLSARHSAKQVQFHRLSTRLPDRETGVVSMPKDELQGLSLGELSSLAKGFASTGDDRGARAEIELQRRFALPLATLVFGFLSVPLFLSRSQFSRSASGVLGVLATIGYYGLVQLGEGLYQGGRVSAVVGVWLPNGVLFVLAGGLLVRALRSKSLGQSFDRPQVGRREAERAMRPTLEHLVPYALPRYVAGRFVAMAALSFAVIFSAYLLIDVMERLEWFARHRATGPEILRFYGARVWLLASRAVPMALLVGTALTASLLAVEGELVGMRACGIPAPRALLPVLVVSVLFTPFYFVLSDVIVPRTNALADELKRTQIKDLPSEDTENRGEGEWFRSKGQVVEASFFDPEDGEADLVTVYELGEDGLPISRTDAQSARHIGHGEWRLHDPARVELFGGSPRVVPAPEYLRLGEALPAEVDTMHYSAGELRVEAEAVESAGYDASVLRTDYHVKLAGVLACIVLPAVVMFYAVGGPPFPGPAQTLMASGIIGVGYILLTGVGASLGHGRAIPPVAGGWGPLAVLGLIGGYFGHRLWRRL
ncbi:LptF/LptG family permease [Myxococcota bacterium]|nr:LptF/LptG family permease [Myxococcota bacterium]